MQHLRTCVSTNQHEIQHLHETFQGKIFPVKVIDSILKNTQHSQSQQLTEQEPDKEGILYHVWRASLKRLKEPVSEVVFKQICIWSLAVCKNGVRRPGEPYHAIHGTSDVTGSRHEDIFTFISPATAETIQVLVKRQVLCTSRTYSSLKQNRLRMVLLQGLQIQK